MAQIIGGVGTMHVPAIGKAIAEGRENEAYWQPFFVGFAAVDRWLAHEKPDIAVVFSNDHGLNFFLDKLPTFAVGAAKGYRNEDVTQAHRNYHIPISNTAAATIVRSRRAGPPEALSGYHR